MKSAAPFRYARLNGAAPPAGRAHGAALVLALLALTLGTLIAVALSQRMAADLGRTGAMAEWDQGYLDALAAEAWACGHLTRLPQETSLRAGVDAQGVPRRGASYRVHDLQGRFNLNNLVSGGQMVPHQYQHLLRLLALLGLPADLGARILDWVDEDTQATWPGGAEDDRYRALRPARRTANRPLLALGELLDVYGMDYASFRKLSPYVTALPDLTPVNVNSASPHVLRALLPELPADGLARLQARRRTRPYDSLEEFLDDALPGNVPVDARALTVSSQYFLLETRIEATGTPVILRSLLHASGRARATVLRRQIGYL